MIDILFDLIVQGLKLVVVLWVAAMLIGWFISLFGE
jgi:hypothetical protein